LAGGSVLTGIFAYLYIALGTREYGTEAFSGVAQLWTIWFFAASVLTFPLQHWVVQRLRADLHGGAVRSVLPRLVGVTLGLGVAVSLVTAVLREDLFGHPELAYPVAAGAVTVGSGAMGLLRGGLAGRGRFVATGAAIAGENLVRLVLGAVVIAVAADVDWYGLAIASGILVLILWPSAVRFEGPAVDSVSPLTFLGNIAGGTVIGHTILTAGPVVLSLVGGTREEVTSLFAALALFRAPYIVANGLSIRVTAALTDLSAGGDISALDRIRRRTGLVGVAVITAGGAGAAALGPPILRLIFGDEVDLSGLQCAGLAAGSLAALATLALTLVQMTDGHGRLVLRTWLIGLAVGVLTMVIGLPLDPLPRVVAAFLASELTAFALMALLDGTGDRRPR